ncbi:5-methylthioribose kinase [Microbacterium sp. W4I4]|uniref:S-methyl-5-thioribose kinase n=1 Tax=Microbacterium sp. W4I4 TaxID=3042295 RepID=UPI00278A29D8|nr:S-methyl-5-thioribose kinase [Microbacterium sp. W4I4]MDQ0614072.1 5-methylthioribose kinase [Microbacterium sp. W4I4]
MGHNSREDYEILDVDSVADYLRSRPALAERIDADQLEDIAEIGDGNLNLVFLTHDRSGRGLCLKQALPYVRMTGDSWPMTPERARFEVDSLRLHGKLAPSTVCEVVDYDADRYLIALEDLSDHTVWRAALNNGIIHQGAAKAVGQYIAAVAFGTSALGMDRHVLAAVQARSLNPELCQITEDLVFTEPSVDSGRNGTIPANHADLRELAADEEFVSAMGRAKWKFMTQAEALIHGDLHTGSVMVRSAKGSTTDDSVKVFDSEFAFYGPVGFDHGLLWANFVFAAARSVALGEDARADQILSFVGESWHAFENEMRALWPGRIDPRVWRECFLEERIVTWQEDSWLFAAGEMSRRVVGAAKTSDIESLPEDLREGAVRGVLNATRQVVRVYRQNSTPESFTKIVGDALREARTTTQRGEDVEPAAVQDTSASIAGLHS